jgi:hypothetical protein
MQGTKNNLSMVQTSSELIYFMFPKVNPKHASSHMWFLIKPPHSPSKTIHTPSL